jgi:hypothetical protein
VTYFRIHRDSGKQAFVRHKENSTPPAVSCKPAKAELTELSAIRDKTPSTFFQLQAYEFASNPENLPKWAAGLSGSIKNVNEDWIAESSMGTVKVKFAETNKFGVLKSRGNFAIRVKVYNPMRVFPNNDGSELVLRSTAGRTCQITSLRKMPRR